MEAVVIMGTKTNKTVLLKLGFPGSKLKQASESDLIIAIKARDKGSVGSALRKVEELLDSDGSSITSRSSSENAPDLDSALVSMSNANLALISVPGEYVKDLSLKLSDNGIHQQIFSDHVSLDDELKIKEYAAKKGVLILGPGAGTSIINGKGIGFSNDLHMGPVGIVAAAGTGLQEVSCLLDQCGIGVKHGLGVGANDPKEKIGGLMMLESLKVLEELPEIEILTIVSKPPSMRAKNLIIDYIVKNGKKKYVLSFLGAGHDGAASNSIKSKAVQVNTLASAVFAVASLVSGQQLKLSLERIHLKAETLQKLVAREWKRLGEHQKYIRALYTGGTFAYETQVILNGIIKDLYSNAPTGRTKKLSPSSKSEKNSILDLGEEEFTHGRPHPMIDPTIRRLRLVEESRDAEVGVIMMDFVLGYGSNADPVGAVLKEIEQAKATARKSREYLSIVTHVCGTKKDPQGYDESVRKLQNAGALVLPTNALAAIASAQIISRGKLNLDKIYSGFFMEGMT